MEQIVHRGSKVVVEVSDECLIVFTNHTIYAGINTYEKYGGLCSSHIRMFAYIVEEGHFQTEVSIKKVLNEDKCNLPCETCESLVYETTHYEGHVIRYLKSKCDKDNLPMGEVLLGNLEKVGWVVLKFDYDITANSREQNLFYHLNNKSFKKVNIDEILFIKQTVRCFTILMNISMNKYLLKKMTFEI